MSDYQLTWITGQLAVGRAPMSYEDLDLIRVEGIGAIVNLCGEFCDLHEIEENAGFEVFYLPIPDECAPDMEEMEKALVRNIGEDIETVKDAYPGSSSCGAETNDCCYRYVDLDLIEAIYLSNTMNRLLGSAVRKQGCRN